MSLSALSNHFRNPNATKRQCTPCSDIDRFAAPSSVCHFANNPSTSCDHFTPLRMGAQMTPVEELAVKPAYRKSEASSNERTHICPRTQSTAPQRNQRHAKPLGRKYEFSPFDRNHVAGRGRCEPGTFRSIRFRPINPNAVRLNGHVAGTDQREFAGTAAGEHLQSNHVGHDGRQVGHRRVDDRFADGEDSRSF